MDNSYTREDFENGNEVRWCPGCGDYAILTALQKLLPELGLAPEQHVFVSGIGCAGRLPYYMNAYGFHTIHGRATAIATGLKAMRDDLTVWVITGDGDALSIGGNHLIHALRRNPNINILLFNNQIYGLTKGQSSPTSPVGQITKTAPQGVTNEPINPLLIALASGASFVARAVDKDPSHLSSIIKQAYEHPGCSFVEIYQDCNIFNHGAFDDFSLKTNRSEQTIVWDNGQPLIYGETGERVLGLEGDYLKKITYDVTDTNILRHDVTNFYAATRLAKLHFPDYPVPLGVYYKEERGVYSLSEPKIQKSMDDLHSLYRSRASWQQF